MISPPASSFGPACHAQEKWEEGRSLFFAFLTLSVVWLPLVAFKAFVALKIAALYAVPFVSSMPFYQAFGALVVFQIFSIGAGGSGSERLSTPGKVLTHVSVVCGALLLTWFCAWVGTFFILPCPAL